jgi:hypothetical protein
MRSEFSARREADPQNKSVIPGAGPIPPPNRQEGMMNARNDVKRQFNQRLDPWHVLAAVRRRFAARVDLAVARWLQRCAGNIETAQRLFESNRKPSRELGMNLGFFAPSPRWDESP